MAFVCKPTAVLVVRINNLWPFFSLNTLLPSFGGPPNLTKWRLSFNPSDPPPPHTHTHSLLLRDLKQHAHTK